MIEREIDIPWMWLHVTLGGNRGAPVGGSTCGACFPTVGWNPGFESQELYDFWKETSEQVAGSPENLATREQYWDYMHLWRLQVGVAEIPKLYTYNGNKVASWALERNSSGVINGLDSVVLRR